MIAALPVALMGAWAFILVFCTEDPKTGRRFGTKPKRR